MLAWVTNSPDLTDGLVESFGDFVRERHGDAHAVCRRAG